MHLKKLSLSVRFLISIATITLMLILLIFPKASIKGAENGILLWFNVIVPTLLPFIIVSNLIINLKLTTAIARLFYPVLHKLFAVTKNGCYVIIIGLLTGFPVGAKACSDLVKNKMLSKEEGQYLLTFCNNASPMFIISYISILTLKLSGMQYQVLGIIYLSAILTALLYRRVYHIHTKTFKAPDDIKTTEKITLKAADLPRKFAPTEPPKRITFAIVDGAIMDGFDVITKVGGYIILFSILSNVILAILPMTSFYSLLSVGILEITNGINAIGGSSLSFATKIALILPITAFGGISSIAQTKSVIDQSGLSIRKYIFYKAINALITILLTFLLIELCKF